MSKLVSIHQINFGGADIIEPNRAFEATAEEVEFLLPRGAARKFNGESDKGLAEQKRPGAQAAIGNEPKLPDVSKAKKEQLLLIAQDENVEGLTGEENVEQLRAAILANRETKDESLV